MTNHSTSDQVTFCVGWFNGWSELQKDDFVTILTQKISPEKFINGLVNGIQHLGTRPPSLFACQIKLFNEWWTNWTEEDKERFNTSLKNTDSKFWNELEAELKGERKKDDDEFFFTVTAPTTTSVSNGSNHNQVTVSNNNINNSSSSSNTVEVAEEATETILNEEIDKKNKTTITVSADAEAIITSTNTSTVQVTSQSVNYDNNNDADDNVNTSGNSEVTVIES